MGFFNDLKEDLANTVNEVTEETVEKQLNENEKVIKADIASFDKNKNEQKATLELEIQNILNGIDNKPLDTPDQFIIKEEEQVIDLEEFEDEEEILDIINKDNSVKTSNINLMIQPTKQIEEEIDEIEEEDVIEDKEDDEEVVTVFDPDLIFSQPAVDEDTMIITAGTTVNGDIISTSFLDIRGSINGNIDIKNNVIVSGEVLGDIRAREVYVDGAIIRGSIISDRTVQVSEKSVIIGELRAEAAYIAGAVKGNIDISNSVILDSSAKVLGNINCKFVQINNGAILEGKCSQSYSDETPSAFFENF